MRFIRRILRFFARPSAPAPSWIQGLTREQRHLLAANLRTVLESKKALDARD